MILGEAWLKNSHGSGTAREFANIIHYKILMMKNLFAKEVQCSFMDVITIIVCIVVAVVVGVAAFFLGVTYRRKVAEAEIMSAEDEAETAGFPTAIKAAESKKKEALVEAKDDIYKMRSEAEKEVKDRRSEVQLSGAPYQSKGRKPGPEAGKLRKKGRSLAEKDPGCPTSPGRGRRSQKTPV